VEESDYAKIGTRGACLVMFLFAIGWMMKESLAK
jgi:hypothetical protein